MKWIVLVAVACGDPKESGPSLVDADTDTDTDTDADTDADADTDTDTDTDTDADSDTDADADTDTDSDTDTDTDSDADADTDTDSDADTDTDSDTDTDTEPACAGVEGDLVVDLAAWDGSGPCLTCAGVTNFVLSVTNPCPVPIDVVMESSTCLVFTWTLVTPDGERRLGGGGECDIYYPPGTETIAPGETWTASPASVPAIASGTYTIQADTSMVSFGTFSSTFTTY